MVKWQIKLSPGIRVYLYTMKTEEQLKAQLNYKKVELRRAQSDVGMYRLSAGSYTLLKRAETKIRTLNAEIKDICNKLNKFQNP